MFGIGSFELLVILLVALMVIGPQRLPELARKLGKAFASVRKEVDNFKESIEVVSRNEDERD